MLILGPLCTIFYLNIGLTQFDSFEKKPSFLIDNSFPMCLLHLVNSKVHNNFQSISLCEFMCLFASSKRKVHHNSFILYKYLYKFTY